MKLFKCRTIGKLLFTSVLLMPAYAIAASYEPPQRFSFAISGGASLGAYEAGLNWALLTIMKGLENDRPTLQGQYRPIEISSVAGASAGGINTLLSGMLYCSKEKDEGGLTNDIDDNIFRHVWFLPDINDLLPPDPKSKIYSEGDATLSRKTLLEAAGYLQEKWKSPAFRKGCRVPLGITVTRVDPAVIQIGDVEVRNQRFSIPFEFRIQDDNTGRFSFNPRDYQIENDYSMILLPSVKDRQSSYIEDQVITDAIMASSAFPIAFGRKQLNYCRLKADYKEENAERSSEIEAESNGSNCPEGYELMRAEFADGGLFDNLPLGLARKLAEKSKTGKYSPLPVTYVYIDPDRKRFSVPEIKTTSLCDQPNPPRACVQMEFGLESESQLLLGALGTARKYELYRELISEAWSLNMSTLSYELADLLEKQKPKFTCALTLPYFEKSLPCHQALRYTGALLEVSYDRIQAPITKPFSVNKLKQAGLIKECRRPETNTQVAISAECIIKSNSLRAELSTGMLKLLSNGPVEDDNLKRRVRASSLSVTNDRIIRVTTRGAHVTAGLLNSFGAFLDVKFREYDYYVGIYDAVVIASKTVCDSSFSEALQLEEYRQCRNAVSEQLYNKLGLPEDPDGRYLFALLAKNEFADVGGLRFAYVPMPAIDNDMKIIHEAMAKVDTTLERQSTGIKANVETEFFEYLRDNGFTATPNEDDSTPLLANIMNEPNQWTYELTRRFTNRLDYLESQSKQIKAQRDPKSDTSSTIGSLVGPASLAIRTATYKYPAFDFAPSTAPKSWIWRNVIPYELALDLNQADLWITWQPTWALSRYNTLGIRGTLGFAEGLTRNSNDSARSNFVTLGLDYTRHTNSSLISSWGVTPGVYHNFRDPAVGDQDSLGGDVHIGMLKNRLRIGLGARDFQEFNDSWYLTLGLADLPGFAYWLSR